MKSFRIEIYKRAKRDIKKLDPDARQKVQKAIDALGDNPRKL